MVGNMISLIKVHTVNEMPVTAIHKFSLSTLSFIQYEVMIYNIRFVASVPHRFYLRLSNNVLPMCPRVLYSDSQLKCNSGATTSSVCIA